MLIFTFEFLVIVIIAALIFDFINGFHDAANSIATVVSTRVLSPGLAVIWAAFFNFVAAFVFPLTVAKTIGKGLVAPDAVTVQVIFAGLAGGIAWDLLTWYWGLPTSSSHALIGGYAGAAIASAGFSVVIVGGWTKTIVSMFLSPVVGLVLGVLMMTGVHGCSAQEPGPGRSLLPTRSVGLGWPSTASATAATTRRRRWESSPGSSSPRGTCGRSRCRSGSS
jgi:PiT family inorganic phosphate transporter